MKTEITKYLHQHKSTNFSSLLFLYIDKSGLKDSMIYKKAGIDESGMTDAECYKKANVDRKLFSKIRCNDYILNKKTIIRLCFVLKLSLDEANELLNSAGYALSKSQDFDLIIQFCLEKKIYDLYIVNEMLETFLKTVL